MLSPDQQRSACDLLWKQWQSGETTPGLPDELRPADRADGYAIQAMFERFTDFPLYGWKIAATSVAGQQHIGVDGPLAGRILREWVVEPGATVSLSGNHMLVVEAEFAFRLGETLAPRAEPYPVNEVLAAVSDLHLTLEVPDSRFTDFPHAGAPQLIADVACAHRLVVGPAVAADWRALDLAAFTMEATTSDGQTHPGAGSNVLGDPREALAWLVNEVCSLGLSLEAGQLVTTGTCIVPAAVRPGLQLVADFRELGRISVEFEQ